MAHERDSMFRYKGSGGDLKSWYPTERDRQIVLECSRWAMLTSWDIATRVMPLSEWYVTPPADDDESIPLRTEGLDVSFRAVKRVRERLTRLTNSYPHPLLTATLRGQFASVYQATGSGNMFVGIDAAPSRISPSAQSYSMTSGHMLASARVGRCFELNGFRVLSEKESSSEIALDDGPVPPQMVSFYAPNKESKPVSKKPDLVLPTADGTGYVAVEVELTKHRQPLVYETKLYAYTQNPACHGVLYVTSENSVATRVNAAAQKVMGDNFTQSLAVMRMRRGTFDAVRPLQPSIRHIIGKCARIDPDPTLADRVHQYFNPQKEAAQ